MLILCVIAKIGQTRLKCPESIQPKKCATNIKHINQTGTHHLVGNFAIKLNLSELFAMYILLL